VCEVQGEPAHSKRFAPSALASIFWSVLMPHAAPQTMKMALAGCVPQIFNLLYRRLAVGKALDGCRH
jgi:hypothetical protein